MTNQSSHPVVAALAFLAAFFVTCSRKEPPAILAEAAPAEVLLTDPDAENPDRGKWVDLRRHAFRPEWVGGTFVVFRLSPPETLNNLLWVSGDARSWAKQFLYPFLLVENPDRTNGRLQLEPWAADGMPVLKDDQRTYVWKLKSGLTWEDGKPVTAGDYVFTWKLLQDPQIEAASRRASLERVESVTALDDRVFEVRFKEPYYNCLVAFGLEFTVVPEHAVPKDPDEFNKLRKTLSFGPYRVVEQGQERLSFELRPEYRKSTHPIGPHYLERVEVRFNKDMNNRFQQLRSGSAHLDSLSHDQFVDLAGDQEFRRNCWRASYYMPAWIFCAWNLRDPSDPTHDRPHPLVSDERVRQALSHLFPRQRLCAEYYHGLATPISGPFFFKEADNDPSIPPAAYDPEAARRLLADAGWRLNDGGLLEKGGQVFRITLNHPQGAGWAQGVSAHFVEAARKVGIEVAVRDLPREPLNQALANHSFDGLLAINSISPAIEPDVYELFHSSQAKTGGYNWSGLADSTVDTLIAAYRREVLSPTKRLAIRQQLHRRIAELQPLAFLYSAATCVGVSRRWANVKVHDLGILYRDMVWRELWEKHPPRPN
jgi:peptide/nickel transport system substrate-binding protein